MGKVTHLDDFRPAPGSLFDAPTCTWAELHGRQGELRVAEHEGLSVLLFVEAGTGRAYVIGEKTHG